MSYIAINCLQAFLTLPYPARLCNVSPMEHTSDVMGMQLQPLWNVEFCLKVGNRHKISLDTIWELYQPMPHQMTACIQVRGTFPLITTKKVFWRGICEELLWFISGSTDANVLKKKNVHIWDANSSKEYMKSINLSYPEEGLVLLTEIDSPRERLNSSLIMRTNLSHQPPHHAAVGGINFQTIFELMFLSIFYANQFRKVIESTSEISTVITVNYPGPPRLAMKRLRASKKASEDKAFTNSRCSAR
ncbi:bifunctional dihydrofolate reductase-thymidylate synthase [Trichonephila clavipes]|uniref:Thymidylate synthase n=1 Tax=Trichonephila clavipes TaxID=2585209 RepID=A0A8X6S3T0_TRICX|nr:bifunctional dihydrofolate reductase-thymidylate synthase [Trichonephila clavipes]